jgi:hypothetical protein
MSHLHPQESLEFSAQQVNQQKVMATVFWDVKGVLLLDFLERNHTITGKHYLDQLEEQLHPSIRSKRRGRCGRVQGRCVTAR